VDENIPDQIQSEQVECWCFQHPEDIALATCPGCKGKGSYTFYTYPFEEEITTTYFLLIMSALIIDIDPNDIYGSMNAIEFLKAVEGLRSELIHRADMSHTHNSFETGIDSDRARRYISRFKSIAVEATRRHAIVTWQG